MARTTDFKEGKATVKAVYYTSKTLADGSHPFMVRITKDRKLKYIATGLSLHPKYWNEKKGEIRKSYPGDSKALWKKLKAQEAKFEAAAEALAEDDRVHDPEIVAVKANELRKKLRRVGILAYTEELAQSMSAAGQIGNAGVYRDLANQLAKFIASECGASEPPTGKGKEKDWLEWVKLYDIPFDRADVAFCNEWEMALRATGAAEITLSLRFRTLRAVLNKAIANGVAKASTYPFARNVAERHKFSVGKFDVTTSKRAITREDIRLLEDSLPDTDRMRLAKNVFLFSFYCGGINFVDLAQLRWRDLHGSENGLPQRLQYTRQKTRGKFSLRLLAPALNIVAAYEGLTRTTQDSYIFPVLNSNLHQTPTQIKNRLHKVLGQVNKDLKVLGESVGITTPITTYVARHSFATNLKQFGVATAVISEAMGHKSEAVTAVYLDSFASNTVDSAFEHLL
ncbi:site-specific integrase [Hymenobacter sp. 5516J-16]|uniref:site-specific integrase n=1 Tax=Hymenobacter sp. 5516J-16 TaxID=2932253 RepID=UPI001FD4C44A|nr:site-specific integrase [Hymenobacter sp. 5516J-16]UOQ78552.1 site-specific integrase [Hymenobacter sp. 5516J-16]